MRTKERGPYRAPGLVQGTHPHRWQFVYTNPSGVDVESCALCSAQRHVYGGRVVWPGCRHLRRRGDSACEACKRQLLLFPEPAAPLK